MRKVVFAINITADGYCGHEDMVADEAMHDHFTDLLSRSDVIVYGRKTYELMVPYWPDIAREGTEDEASLSFARVFDALEKVVFSTTWKSVQDHRTRLAHGDLADEIVALKAKPGEAIAIGSLSLASQLSAHGLIDEYHFVVHPVVAGKGPRMFEALALKEHVRLDLVDTKTFPSGAIALHYRKVS